MVYGDKMKEQKKQYILSGLSWLNIIALAPVFFFTAIYNAQVYTFRIHTEEANFLLGAYVAQIVLLLSFFLAAVLMQLNIKRKIRRQALAIVACESVIALAYTVMQIISHEPMHMYGWVLRYFFTSYIGIGLFVLNIAGAIFYFKGFKAKDIITKFVLTNVCVFSICLIYINFIK